jgi:hypothetical protein
MNPPIRPGSPPIDLASGQPGPAAPDRPGLRRAGWALWPAFMAAAVLEMAVFALVDPEALHAPGGGPLALSRTAVYSLAFLGFWATTAAAAAVALWLSAGQGQAPQRWPDE